MTTGLARDRVIRRLQTAGFELVRDDSVAFLRLGGREVRVGAEDPVSRATLLGILRDAGLDEGDFEDLGFH